MSTDIESEELTQETTTAVEETPVAIEELLEFKRERVHGDQTPCPACNLLVPISARRCQHCESNIEASNALVRETLRHIDEIAAQIDNEGRTLDRAWRSIKNRLKRAFGGTTTIEGIVPEGDARGTLTGVEEGAQVTVVAVHGAWALVRTSDGREGWVYSIPRGGA